MPTIRFQYDTDAERLELERAAAYVTEMRQLGRPTASSRAKPVASPRGSA